MYKKTIPVLIMLFILLITPVRTLAWDGLLILAPDEFLDELAALVRFKNATCRPTTVLGLTQIYSTYGGVDKAEQIKRCIEYYEKNKGVRSVLLVGDINKFPARWRWWGRWMPNDPYFRGNWAVTNGQYRQSEYTKDKPYAAWIDIGSENTYTIQVDCRPVQSNTNGWQVRVIYADADRSGSSFRAALFADKLQLVACDAASVNQSFNFNQTYSLKIQLTSDSVRVWVNGVYKLAQDVKKLDSGGRGKIGLGTWRCDAIFDNLKITYGNTMWFEKFDDGVANAFVTAPNMEERNWMVSDLYFADLYENNGAFENWNRHTTGNFNNLFGEIEFRLTPQLPNAVLNYDKINFLPDVAVGRIPASTAERLEHYLKKIIWYETATRQTDAWFKKVYLYEGKETGGGGNNTNIATYLQGKGFNVSNRLWKGDLANLTNDQRKNLVINNINQGAGLINYLGHGNVGLWDINFTHTEVKNDLTNARMLPIVAAGACFTSKFAPIIPTDNYYDVNDQYHRGTQNCERFPGPPEFSTYAVPRATQTNNPGCIGEDFLLLSGSGSEKLNGAIAYLGERSAGRNYGNQLTEFFFKAYKTGTTIGDMWKKMITDYYWHHNLDKSDTWAYTPKDWDKAHMFDEPQKFVLFGDPSIRVGGAFNALLSGTVSGHLMAFTRYRIVNDIIVPASNILRADSTVCILFESGKKIVTTKTNSRFHLKPGGSGGQWSVTLISGPKTPRENYKVRGIRVKGELLAKNGGGIKLY